MPRIKQYNQVKTSVSNIFPGKGFNENNYSSLIQITRLSKRLNLLIACLLGFLTIKRIENTQINNLYKRFKTRPLFQQLFACRFYNEHKIILKRPGYTLLNNIQYLFSEVIQILVFNNCVGENIFYIGKPRHDKQIFLVLHNDGYYSLIRNIRVFLHVKYFCPFCYKQCRNSATHQFCKNVCLRCRTRFCVKLTNTKYCDICRRYFYGDLCFQKHITAMTCQQIQRCKLCDLEIYPNTTTQHICEKDRCKVCQIAHPPGMCYILTGKEKKRNQSCKIQTDSGLKQVIFFDTETININNRLIPILCVAGYYVNLTYAQNRTRLILKEFFGETCIHDFLIWLLSGIGLNSILICHNLKAFDGMFILNEVYKLPHQIEVIFNGSKINLIVLKNRKFTIKFIDSFNFVSTSLREMGGIFSVKNKKTFFPYSMLTSALMNYNGALPARECYETFLFKKKELKDFEIFYKKQEKIYKKRAWNLKDVLIRYCRNDVIVLSHCMTRFRTLVLSKTNLDPFKKITLASIAIEDFTKNHLQPHSLGIVPANGYSKCSQQSYKAMLYIKYQEYKLGFKFQHAWSPEGEFKIGNYKLDACNIAKNIAFDFHGF